MELTVTALAASTRSGSHNRRLLDAITASIAETDAGVEVDVIDLRRHPLPLLDADLMERDGVPDAARVIHDRIAASDAVLIASPEYNGGYPALLKNVIDWISRVDMFVLHPRYVGLAAASPGKTGGVRGAAHLRGLLENMFVTVHDDVFSVPQVGDALTDEGWANAEDEQRLAAWTTEFVAAARGHARARAEA